jgi:hypothetical protein
MKQIDFYALPRSGQDRLLDSCRGAYDPRPMAVTATIRPRAELWAALAVGSAVALIAAWAIGFGQLGNGLARHPLPFVGLFAILGSLVGLGVVQAIAYRAAIAALPFRPGIYLFAGNAIDARESVLRVYPIEEATAVAAKGTAAFQLSFLETKFVFVVEEGHADQAVQLVEQAKSTMTGDVDEQTRRDNDPTMPLAVLAPLAPTVPLERPSPGWLSFRMIAPLLVAAIAIGLFFARDGASDGALYAAARAKGDAEAYRAYLAQGDAHRDEVHKTLLPRVELQEAIGVGTVEAIDELAAAHPEAAIGEEIAAARRTALAAAFEVARAKGTFAALVAFDATYPKHHLAAAITTARQANYDAAHAKFVAGLPERSTAIGAFAKKLLAVIAKTGPTQGAEGIVGPPVQVRVQRVASKGMDRADKVVRRNPYYVGEPSLPTRYLDAAHLAPHEAAVAKAFASDLARGFSSEILTLETGDLVEGKDLPKVDAPTIFVGYRVEPSGGAYASRKPRGIYMGLVFFYDVQFHLPGEAEPLKNQHIIEMRVPVKVLAAQKAPFERGAVERALYDAMVKQGFEELRKRYFRHWYR